MGLKIAPLRVASRAFEIQVPAQPTRLAQLEPLRQALAVGSNQLAELVERRTPGPRLEHEALRLALLGDSMAQALGQLPAPNGRERASWRALSNEWGALGSRITAAAMEGKNQVALPIDRVEAFASRSFRSRDELAEALAREANTPGNRHAKLWPWNSDLVAVPKDTGADVVARAEQARRSASRLSQPLVDLQNFLERRLADVTVKPRRLSALLTNMRRSKDFDFTVSAVRVVRTPEEAKLFLDWARTHLADMRYPQSAKGLAAFEQNLGIAIGLAGAKAKLWPSELVEKAFGGR